MHDDVDRAEEIFCAALPMAEEERSAYLAETCGSDRELRARVEGMLSRQAEARRFFDASRPGINVAALAGRLVDAATEAWSEPDLETGNRVGSYRLLEKLGEGGCGVVYLAQQDQPVRRQVALKIIKLGMDTRGFIARFNAERRTLAMMDHPNIAYVLDAGATETGRPYLAMELVRGTKITRFCDENKHDIRRRLSLFIQVCHAIQHAHQKGVIHRDIKASNVLVTLIDGVAVPKVIDFGVAKAVGGEPSANQTVLTTCELFIGTPAYMSPEQAETGGLAADTRSDVYSLGVLLYELLTGETPFSHRELIEAGPERMRRILREKEPPPPSAKLAGMPAGELALAAAHRREHPAKLGALLKRDLDWIAMKALEKDRDRRYPTAIGLALDVQRYLNNEAVQARPPSRSYQFRKFVRRNRAVFVSLTAVGLALVAGFGTSTWLFFQAREAHRAAEKGRATEALLRRQAEANLTVAKAASLIDKYQMQQADELVGALPTSDMATVGAALFRPLGDWAAVRGDWRRAAEYYSALVRLDLSERPDPATLDYTKYTVILAELGDRRAYDEFCRASIKQFSGTASPVAAERTLKLCSLLPPDPGRIAELSPFAEATARSVAERTALTQADWPVFWRHLSLALFEYRRGDYAEALDHGARCLEFDALENVPPRAAGVHAIAAMCFARLGRDERARAELARSRALIDERAQTPFVAYDDSRGWWYDWFVARILAREAEAMIGGAPTPGADGE